MAAEYDNKQTFRKSGFRRLRDAKQLAQPPTLDARQSDADTRHLRGAMYLAGYGVECLLKAYLINQEQCRSLAEAQDKINERREKMGLEPIKPIATSAAGHNLEYLLHLTDLESRLDNTHRILFSVCAKWRSTWRYDPSSPSLKDAEAFLVAADTITRWIDRQI